MNQNMSKNSKKDSKLKSEIALLYYLYLAGFLFTPLIMVGFSMTFFKANDVKNTWLESHLKGLRATFWIFLAGLFALCGVILFFIDKINIWLIIIAPIILFGLILYRIIRGLMLLNQNESWSR